MLREERKASGRGKGCGRRWNLQPPYHPIGRGEEEVGRVMGEDGKRESHCEYVTSNGLTK